MPATARFSIQPSSKVVTFGSSTTISARITLINSIYNSPNVVWQQSNDSVTWTLAGSGTATATSTTPGIIDLNFTTSNLDSSFSGKRYRIIAYDSRESYNITSNVVFITVISPTPTPTPTINCQYIECGGTQLYADCGMIYEPGYTYVMDCNSCNCVKLPNAKTCNFIECGGSLLYADCGMIYEPGYTYRMDCNLCKCVKSLNIQTPTPTLVTRTPVPTKTPTPTPTSTKVLAPTPTPTPTRAPNSTPFPTATPVPAVVASFTSHPNGLLTKFKGQATFNFSLTLQNSAFNSPNVVWQISRNLSSWADIRSMFPNATSSISSVSPGYIDGELIIPVVNIGLSGMFLRVVCSSTREKYSVTSNTVPIHIQPPMARFASHPSVKEVDLFGSTEFSFQAIVANPSGVPTIKWQYSKNLTRWTDVSSFGNLIYNFTFTNENPMIINSTLMVLNAPANMNGMFFRGVCSSSDDGYFLVSSSASLFLTVP